MATSLPPQSMLAAAVDLETTCARCLVRAVSPPAPATKSTALSPLGHWYIYMHYLALALALAPSLMVSPCTPAFKRPFPCAPYTCHPAPVDTTFTGRPNLQP